MRSMVWPALVLISTSACFGGEKLLSDLRMEQAVTKQDSGYASRGDVKISFVLANPAEVTITVARHNATGEGIDAIDTPVLPEPILVKTIKAGALQAGRQEVVWDGLDDKGQLITEPLPGFRATWEGGSLPTFAEFMQARAKDPAKAGKPLSQDELVRRAPVDLLRITVLAGKEQVAGNFRRQRGPVASWLKTRGMLLDGRQLPDGDFVVIDRAAWFGFRLGPNLRQKGRYPKVEAAWTANRPVEGNVVRVDSKGTVYIRTRNCIYKYLADGTDATWEEKAGYINGMGLGVRLEEGKPESAEKLKQPGFAYEWTGFDVGPDDNLYFVRALPEPLEIQMFAPSGKYLRSIPLPKAPFANQNTAESIRFGKDGTLWVGSGEYFRVNPQTGAVEKKLYTYANYLTFSSEGNMLITQTGADRGIVGRCTAEGAPMPFTAESPYLIREGEFKGWLDFKRPEKTAPADDPSRGKMGAMVVLPGNAGDFYVIPWDTNYPPAFPVGDRAAIHFTRDGQLIEQLTDVAMSQERPGNVFVGDEPARINLYATNLSDKPLPFIAQWTLTDFDGKQTQGKASFIVSARTHLAVPLPLEMPELGHYRLKGKVLQGQAVAFEFDTMAARIRPRNIETSPDSPFCIVWGTNYYLSGISGAKKERVGVMPPSLWIAEGVARPDLPEVRSLRRGGLSGTAQESLRWKVRSPIMLTYGEPWLTGHWMAPIYSYDTWLKDIAIPLIGKFAGPDVQHVQFWNEPCNFLYGDDGKFNLEHYGLLSKLVWSICKARDKEGKSIPDGDCTIEFGKLAALGVAPFTDGLPTHYPGAGDVAWTAMTLPSLPEGKVESIRKLIAERDRNYPGKPVLNTEEGWWGHRDIKPDEAAAVLARVYIPQLAAGADEIYWFAQLSVDDPTYMLGAEDAPWPSYCAYATMTRMLEGAEYLGTVDLGVPATFAFLFGRGDETILPLWAAQGEPEIKLNCAAIKATVTDMMDRERELKPADGTIALKLSVHTQYLRFPRNAWAAAIAKAELKRRLDILKLDSAAVIAPAAAEAAKTALADNASMTRLFYLLQAARHAALAGEAPKAMDDPAGLADAAHKAILKREGQDGYLRQARVAFGWTGRLARLAARENKALAPGLTWAAKLAAEATQTLAAAETPCYPGTVVNAYIGNTGEIAKIRETKPVLNKPETRCDAQFRFQIDAKPGDAFELELTVRDFYKYPIKGIVMPRLPDGWKAAPAKADYAVQPADLQRFMFTVSIPADAKPGVYPLGGKTDYQGQTIAEIHTQRVNVPK